MVAVRWATSASRRLIELSGRASPPSRLGHAGRLALSLLIGFEAGTLRRWSLDRRGWSTLGAVSGRNAEDCERRFFDMWLPTQPDPGPAGALGGDVSRPGGWSRARRSLLGALSAGAELSR